VEKTRRLRGIRNDDGSIGDVKRLKTKFTPTKDLDVGIEMSDHWMIWASSASAGLLLALAHLAHVYASPEGGLLLLEEPENGLNETIMLDMMRALLAAVRSRNQQLILTTHQAWWLDIVPHDAIRITTRDENGGHVQAPAPDEIRRIVEEKNLYPSEVMSLHGPDGLLRLGRANANKS
jgi:predicted ATPase